LTTASGAPQPPSPRRRARIVALLLVPAAALVAAAMLFARMRLEPPTVPPYEIADGGGVAVLHPGDRFELFIEPTAQVEGAVAARGFLLRGDEVRPWDPPYTVDRDGSVRIGGTVRELFAGVPPGEWDVAIAVGRPETLPTSPRDVLRARDAGASEAAWHLVRERVRLEA